MLARTDSFWTDLEPTDGPAALVRAEGRGSYLTSQRKKRRVQQVVN